LNFKPLEESFGPIQILHGREKDVLTLQEDKISYVLTGANILSDAGAGNLLLSVPEVLGNQIARLVLAITLKASRLMVTIDTSQTQREVWY